MHALTIHLPHVRRIMGGTKAPITLEKARYVREFRSWLPPRTFIKDGEARHLPNQGAMLLLEPRPLAIHASQLELDLLSPQEERDLPKGLRGAVCAVAQLAGWRHEGQANFAWLLRDVVVLPEPVTCSGRQRLWQLPAAVEEAVLRQVGPR